MELAEKTCLSSDFFYYIKVSEFLRVKVTAFLYVHVLCVCVCVCVRSCVCVHMHATCIEARAWPQMSPLATLS